jgi:hypothetical protein
VNTVKMGLFSRLSEAMDARVNHHSERIANIERLRILAACGVALFTKVMDSSNFLQYGNSNFTC